MFLGRLAYLKVKTGGDKSMPGKRCTVGGVMPVVVLRDPRDMVKA